MSATCPIHRVSLRDVDDPEATKRGAVYECPEGGEEYDSNLRPIGNDAPVVSEHKKRVLQPGEHVVRLKGGKTIVMGKRPQLPYHPW